MHQTSLIDLLNRELNAASPALVGNDDLVRGILAGCGDCIKILDLDGRLQFMSDGGKRVMEVDDFSKLKGCPWPDFWAGEGNAQARAAVAEAKAGRTGRFQNAANTAKGTPKYWDVQVSPIFDDTGVVTHMLSISRDITVEWQAQEAQRTHMERQRFLTEELTHRVKNTLATVLGIAGQTFRGDENREARNNFAARIKTMGAAYNVLTEASWSDSCIQRIVTGALAPYQTGEGRISIEGPAFNIRPGHALTLALAMNELATNAVKYGALSGDDGAVALSWKNDGERFTVDWRETGGPAVTLPTSTGFGTRLVKTMLAQDFGGKVELTYDPAGVVCRLDAPSPQALATL